MGARSRRKGYEGERQVVNMARSLGLEAKRVPLSGGAQGYPGDVFIEGRLHEVKWRGSGFAQLYRWIEGMFALIVRADRHEPLAVLRLEDYLKLIEREKNRT